MHDRIRKKKKNNKYYKTHPMKETGEMGLRREGHFWVSEVLILCILFPKVTWSS